MLQTSQRLIILFLVSLYLVIGSDSDVLAATILSPVSSQKILIQARLPQSILILKVSNKKELPLIRVTTAQNRKGEETLIKPLQRYEKNGFSYIHYKLHLKKGKNRFVINPGEQDLTIRYRPVRTLLNVNFEDPKAFLFHRTAVIPKECTLCHSKKLPKDANLDVARLSKNSDYSPICFSCHRSLSDTNKWLHGPTANMFCMSCHRKGEGNTRITMLSGKVDDVCFQCHINKKKFRELKHVHGPVGTGDCTICHDPHGDKYKFQLWADGKTDLCLGCHSDKRDSAKGSLGFTRHGIIQGGGCIACHSPHATNYRFQLYKPINELCVSCHLELANLKKGHPVGNHPLKGKKDPRRPGRELSCTSCHNPHGSKFRFLLIGDVLGGHVCGMCHNDN